MGWWCEGLDFGDEKVLWGSAIAGLTQCGGDSADSFDAQFTFTTHPYIHFDTFTSHSELACETEDHRQTGEI